MNKEDAPQISDSVMYAILHMLNSSSGKSGGVQEDALLCVSVLVESKYSLTTSWCVSFTSSLVLFSASDVSYIVKLISLTVASP